MVQPHRFHKWDRVRVASESTRYYGSVGQVRSREGGPGYRVKLDGFAYELGFDDDELEPES
jgi:hypothetical protein